jgi:branched-chain amino acid transport system permease protein
MFFQMLSNALVSGLLMGGVYASVAIGLTLIFGVMSIINFAHGSFMMLGMYVAYWLFTGLGLNPYISLVPSFLILFFLGAVIHKFIIIHSSDAQNILLITLGIALFLDNFAAFLWTPDYRSIEIPTLAKSLFIGYLAISIPRLIAFIFAILLTIGLYIFLKTTTTGKSIRAISDNIEGARSVGINIKKISLISFGIGAGCVGAAGAVITPFYSISPSVGLVFVIFAFVVVVLGGMGNFWGTFLGGLIVGLGESLGATYLPGSLQQFFIYFVFILILLFRPQGILGGKRA